MEGRGYEKLVALYLRLNGYFIIENFILHPQDKGPQRGEVDVFGVRLPYQAEKPGETVMSNDPKLVSGLNTGKSRLPDRATKWETLKQKR